MITQMAGFAELSGALGPLHHRLYVEIPGGSYRGYGWPATLELLSPPIGKPVDSRRTFRLAACPACATVHETGGECAFSRHTPTPAAANDGSTLELNARVVQRLIAANLTLAEAYD